MNHPTQTFAELEAHPALLAAVAARGYSEATPVQSAVLAEEARGRDLIVSSRTGSGKTVAFGLAFAQELLGKAPTPGDESEPAQAQRLAATRQPLALVVAPTRELALQVSVELQWLYAQAGGRIATCVGGTDMSRELRGLRDGPHIVVGTPGRLVDHLERKSLQLGSLRALVLDEADEMLDMGFREELERILRDAPKERRTLLFSATIPHAIDQLAKSYQRNALRIQATTPSQQHQDIEMRAHLIAVREREHAVVNTLRFTDPPAAIVFCATRESVNHLHANLLERGFAAVALSGELTQAERTRALKALRDGRARVLVATDVAARGLDLPDVGLVVQADLAQNADVLQHRSGRTGRAGKKGVCVLLVPSSSRRGAELLFKKAGVRVQFSPPPTPDVIRVRDRDRLVREIEALLRDPSEDDLSLARLLLRERSPEELAAALVKLRREALPVPEELPLSAQVLVPPPRGDHPFHARPAAAPPRAQPQTARAPRASEPAQAPSPFHQAPPTPRKPEPTQAPRKHEPAAAPRKPEPAAAPRKHEPAAAPRKHEAEDAPRKHEPAAAPRKHEAEAAPIKHEPAAAPRKHEAPRAPSERPPARQKATGQASTPIWFRVNVGRSRNADPRWLLPLLCRRGEVVKKEIGKIQILADETRFEIVPDAAQRFQRAAARPDQKDPNVRIGPLNEKREGRAVREVRKQKR